MDYMSFWLVQIMRCSEYGTGVQDSFVSQGLFVVLDICSSELKEMDV